MWQAAKLAHSGPARELAVERLWRQQIQADLAARLGRKQARQSPTRADRLSPTLACAADLPHAANLVRITPAPGNRCDLSPAPHAAGKRGQVFSLIALAA